MSQIQEISIDQYRGATSKDAVAEKRKKKKKKDVQQQQPIRHESMPPVAEANMPANIPVSVMDALKKYFDLKCESNYISASARSAQDSVKARIEQDRQDRLEALKQQQAMVRLQQQAARAIPHVPVDVVHAQNSNGADCHAIDSQVPAAEGGAVIQNAVDVNVGVGSDERDDSVPPPLEAVYDQLLDNNPPAYEDIHHSQAVEMPNNHSDQQSVVADVQYGVDLDPKEVKEQLKEIEEELLAFFESYDDFEYVYPNGGVLKLARTHRLPKVDEKLTAEYTQKALLNNPTVTRLLTAQQINQVSLEITNLIWNQRQRVESRKLTYVKPKVIIE